MKIGEAVVTIRRSKKERIRILDSIKSEEGRPWEVFNTYAEKMPDVEYWKRTHKFLKITGFRPGKANALVISRILKGLKSGDDKCENAFWRLYRCCVVDCMNSENKELNNILLERDMEGDPNSTEDIFKSIVKYTSLYGVEIDELKDFYSFWWFERTEALSSIIENNEINMEVIKELVSSSEKKLSKAIDKLIVEVGEVKDLLSESKEDYRQEISKTNDELINLRKSVDEEKVKLENTISSTLTGKITDIEEKIKEKVVAEPVVEKVIDDYLKKTIEENRVAINKLSNSLLEFKKTHEEGNKLNTSKRVAPVGSLVKVDRISKRLRSFYKEVREGHSAGATLGSIVHNFGSFYVESESLIDLLFKDFFTDGSAKEVIVEPTFISTDSLKGIEFAELDIVVFKNVSAGFVEGYLIPTLIQGNSSITNFPKIVVLQDGKLDEQTNSEILKHSLCITNEFLKEVVSADPISKELKELVVIDGPCALPKEYEDLLKILENSGVKIPIEVSEKLIMISEIMKRCLNDSEILSLSTSTVVYPYMRKKYGSVKSETVTEVLKGIV